MPLRSVDNALDHAASTEKPTSTTTSTSWTGAEPLGTSTETSCECTSLACAWVLLFPAKTITTFPSPIKPSTPTSRSRFIEGRPVRDVECMI